jgi:hypothetical protein
MNPFIRKYLKEIVLENQKYIDNAIEKFKSHGDWSKLSELDKLILLAKNGKSHLLKKINLEKIYKENQYQKGNSAGFGIRQIKVKVKDIKDQPIDHEISKRYAGSEGYLMPHIHYDGDEYIPYVTVVFDKLVIHNEYGDSSFDQAPIMLDNLYPIGYSDEPEFFDQHKKDQEKTHQEYLKNLKKK